MTGEGVAITVMAELSSPLRQLPLAPWSRQRRERRGRHPRRRGAEFEPGARL